ncbi:MAG: sialidase family protein, partial [Terriglobales bacterium]
TFTNSSSQHATEVEPGSYAFGSTMVTAFQVGRISSGGGADVGFATSTDAGTTWNSGYIPGITIFQGGGLFSAASDAVVAFDAAHNVWMISSLAINGNATEVVVNRSPDGINWGNPIRVSSLGSPDKNWIVCDDTPSSQFYGHCYVEWDDPSNQDVIEMNTSNDGGLTWGLALNTANLADGIGGVPLVQPNGTVIVPILGILGNLESITAFTSTDGGSSWSAPVTVSAVTDHQVAGNLRTAALPSAQIDATGTVYVTWQDCRFRVNCASNDLVLSSSTDGRNWTSPARVPIDSTTSTVDHFIPGLGVNPTSFGNSAQLTLTYYFYPVSNCGTTCSLGLGYVSSQNAGQTWSASTQLVGGMNLSWLPNTFSGLMVADYISTSYVSGKAFGVFAVANPPNGSLFNEAIYTTPSPLAAKKSGRTFSSKQERPVANAKSDHGPRRFYDEDHEYPIPPPKRNLRRSAKR